jgi:hypothetical protein
VEGVSLATYNGSPGAHIELDAAVKENATAAVQENGISYGSVTGTLSELRKAQRRGVRVTLRDDLNSRAIAGHVPEQMTEELRLRELWGHRVVMGGIIKRNSSGQAIRIDVDRIEPMPESTAARPSTNSLRGAADEISTDDFIAWVRRG